jgi:hypothetical protein
MLADIKRLPWLAEYPKDVVGPVAAEVNTTRALHLGHEDVGSCIIAVRCVTK